MDTLRKALEEIAGMAHDEVCNTQRFGREHLGCSCHVGVAERAIKAWSQEMKPPEYVAVVRPNELGTVHFEPPLVREGGAFIDRMDVRNNADGSVTVMLATKMPEKLGLARVDLGLVDRYRKARAAYQSDMEQQRTSSPGSVWPKRELSEEHDAVARELADAVVAALGEGGTGR